MGGRRKRKKKCSCNKSVPSSSPCGQCIKRSAAKLRQEKAEHKKIKQKQKRSKKEMTEPSQASSRKTTYAVLGMTILSVLPQASREMFPKLKEYLDRGSLTDLVILVPFDSASRHARKHILRILEDRGGAWANDYLVFQWPHESVEAFVLRAANAYDVTHFIDVDRTVLESIVKSPNNFQRVNMYRPELLDGWAKIEAWLGKSCPSYIPVFEKAEEAGVILDSRHGALDKQ